MQNAINLLSKNAQRIQDVLNENNIESNVIELSASTHTASDAAKAIGCEIAQIIKSIIFRIEENNKPILALVSGINRVNETTLEREVGNKIIKANADFTKEVTGFSIGGVPPIGHTNSISIYIDEDLLNFTELWGAAGTPNAVFNLQTEDLIKITGGKIICIK